MKWLLIALIVIPGHDYGCAERQGGEAYDLRPCAIFRFLASLARNPHVAVGVPAMAV